MRLRTVLPHRLPDFQRGQTPDRRTLLSTEGGRLLAEEPFIGGVNK
jgi:hypothetical protein